MGLIQSETLTLCENSLYSSFILTKLGSRSKFMEVSSNLKENDFRSQ